MSIDDAYADLVDDSATDVHAEMFLTHLRDTTVDASALAAVILTASSQIGVVDGTSTS
jgi:hypothetical protein